MTSTATLDSAVLAEQIYQQARALPPERLVDLAEYLEFLTFKTFPQRQASGENGGNLLRDLDGILEGYDFSPELLSEMRREMWQDFGEIKL